MPILEALGRVCRQPDGEQLVKLLHRHAPTWLVQMPTLLQAAELEALQRKTTGATRERMLRELGEAVDAVTAEHPLVLVLEDLHWSDASTLELLSLLARRREPARLLVIGTYRPVDVIVQKHPLRTVKQELQLHGLCAELPLGLLSEAQVAEYLETRFTGGAHGQVPLQILAKMIHRRTDGNPLFMVTSVDDMVSQGVLVARDGQIMLPDDFTVVETRVPDNLQQLIERQIERLSAEERRVLEVASVVGMEFSAAAVAAGLAAEVEAVEEQCAGVVHQERFLRASGTANWPDGTIAAQYSFLHALHREVLYHRIPAGRRQRLHQRIGEREEQAYRERAREIAAELALHFEQGRDNWRAVQYLEQAGKNATRRSAHQEAIGHVTKGLELLKTLPDTLERMQQKFALHIAGVESYSMCGQFQRARQLGERCLSQAQQMGDPTRLLQAECTLGQTLCHLGDFLSAREHVEHALALYNPHHHRSRAVQELGVTSQCYLSWGLWFLGYPDQALATSHKTLALAQGLSHSFSGAFALIFTAGIHQFRGAGHTAQELAEKAIALCQEQGFPVWLAFGLITRGWALAGQGQEEEGIAQMRQGLTAWQATGAEASRPLVLAMLAEVHGRVGQAEEGLNLLEEALAIAYEHEERYYEAELYRLKGELLLAQEGTEESQKSKTCPACASAAGTGERSQRIKAQKSTVPNPKSQTPDPNSEAEACFLKAIDTARRQSMKSLELRAVMSLVRLRQQQVQDYASRYTHHVTRPKLDEAHKVLVDVYNWFTEGFDTQDLREARTLLEALRPRANE